MVYCSRHLAPLLLYGLEWIFVMNSKEDSMSLTDEEAELKKRGYSLGTLIGEGSYAKVKSAHSEKNQKRVAVKIINKKRAPKDFREKFLPRELAIHVKLEHPNIVRCFDLMEFHNKVMLMPHTSSKKLPRKTSMLAEFKKNVDVNMCMKHTIVNRFLKIWKENIRKSLYISILPVFSNLCLYFRFT